MSNFINKYKNMLKNIQNYNKYDKNRRISDNNFDGITADLIRLTHSIEKGLTLNNVKLGYGHEKQKKIISMVTKLENNNSNYSQEAIKMAVNAINSYIKYHKETNYTDSYFNELNTFINEHKKYLDNDFGGVKELKKGELEFNEKEIEKFFKTRHSIRSFKIDPVDEKLLIKAIKLAQTAPSACNRQGYRCYIVDKTKTSILKDWLTGVGGFQDSLDKIIMITGKTSAYRYGENNQYIVSASIFAAYLSLTLHLYGIGACVIQRPVIWTKEWNRIRKEYGISDDEQIVLCLGIGMLKDSMTVPISHRLKVDEICKFIK